MPNELDVGTRRQGDLIDFNPDTPENKVTLERTDSEIQLLVSWSNYESPYAAWFVDVSMKMDEAPSAPLPKQLLFQDSKGCVLLVGCRTSGYSTNVLGPGSGVIRAQYAVLGVQDNIDYQKIEGVQSDVSGLRAWFGSTSLKEKHQYPKDGNPWTLTLTASAGGDISIPGPDALELVASWTVRRTEDETTIRQRLLAQTRAAEPAEWSDLLNAHMALRDLLVISQWRPEVCVVESALRVDDPLTTLDGKTHGDQWRKVVAAHQAAEKLAEPTRRQHLILYSDIGVDGVSKWIDLRNRFSRALDPIISTRYLRGVNPTTMLAQSGPGIEALGYLLMIEDGVSKTSAAASTLRARLERVAADLGGTLPFDEEDWIAGTVRAYNALKHANRALPKEVEILNRWRETVLAVRAWVAIRLGVDMTALTARLKEDSQSSPWVGTS